MAVAMVKGGPSWKCSAAESSPETASLFVQNHEPFFNAPVMGASELPVRDGSALPPIIDLNHTAGHRRERATNGITVPPQFLTATSGRASARTVCGPSQR